MKNLLAALFFVLYLAAHAQADLAARLDDFIKPYTTSNNFYGTIYIGRAGKVLYHKSFGQASIELNVANTNSSAYHLASVSKPFCSASILLLEQQGKLSTNDVISKYIPDFHDGSKITLYQLLTHTSGILNINNLPQYDRMSLTRQPLDSIIKVFKNSPLEFEPGSKFTYSNSNYNVLAFIIEKVSGMSFGDFLKKNIFDVARMTATLHHGNAEEIIPHVATGYAPVGLAALQRAPYLDWTIKTGNGSLVSTAEDLARFDRILYTHDLLGKDAIQKMFTPNLSETAAGWYIRRHNNRTRQYITGRSPGFSTYFARYPDEQLVVIVLSNLYIPSTSEIGLQAASLAFGELATNRLLQDHPLDRDQISKLTGKYKFGSDFFRPRLTLEITNKDGRLHTTFGELLHDHDNEFILRSFWSIIQFQIENNKAVSLTFDGTKAHRIE